ncbi:MAG TPA: hypothetical protein VF765_16630 [Polyangiaceae bacterium]
MRLSPSRLAVPFAAVVLSFSMSASAQDGAPPPVAPATPAPAAAPPAAAPAPAEAAPTERTANNALYVELLGPGLLYSLNYDRAIGPIGARIGIEYWSLSASNANGSSASVTWLNVPITVSYLGIGSLKHMFEVGAGVDISYFGGSASILGASGGSASGSAVTAWGTVILGYRYQPPDGGFFLRAGIDPLIGSGFFLPWPYVGLGATF